MLTGSFASNAYGIARSTNDADLIVNLDSTNIETIEPNLDPRICIQPQMMFETITGTNRYILEVEEGSFKIELFHINPDPSMLGHFKRKIEIDYPELGRTV